MIDLNFCFSQSFIVFIVITPYDEISSPKKFCTKSFFFQPMWNEWQNISELQEYQLCNGLITLKLAAEITSCMKCFRICWKSEIGLRELTWWWDCNTWCYGVGYKSLTGTMKRGELYDVINWIKNLTNALRPYTFIKTQMKNILHLTKYQRKCGKKSSWPNKAPLKCV